MRRKQFCAFSASGLNTSRELCAPPLFRLVLELWYLTILFRLLKQFKERIPAQSSLLKNVKNGAFSKSLVHRDDRPVGFSRRNFFKRHVAALLAQLNKSGLFQSGYHLFAGKNRQFSHGMTLERVIFKNRCQRIEPTVLPAGIFCCGSFASIRLVGRIQFLR